MDYKVKLQNNNNVFRDNNTDLQAVLETINNLPAAGVSENLDEEIATQEEKIASQDELIAGIASALEGKAAGGGAEIDTCTVVFSSDDDELFDCRLFVTVVNNGIISTETLTIALLDPIETIENVLCGSAAFISPSFNQIFNVLIDEESNYIDFDTRGAGIIIPNKKDGEVSIKVTGIL